MPEVQERYSCQCAQRFLLAAAHQTSGKPHQYVWPLRVRECQPGWFDVVDQEEEPLNLWPMCIHEATIMLTRFEENM